MRFLCFLITLLFPSVLGAECGGIDLRSTLSAPEKVEINARLEGVPFAVGNHWKATKNGRVIHLIGTMHIDDPRMDPVAKRLEEVIKAADLVLVEASLEDQQRLQTEIATNPSLAFLTGKTLIDLMPEDDWEALVTAAEARGIPSFMAAKFQPWYLSLILSMSPCVLKKAAAGAKGLDHRLMEQAASAQVPTGSLEHYTTVFSLFSQGSIEEQIDMLSVSILPIAHSENANATLAEQYFEEAHMAALETSRVITRPLINLPAAEFDTLFDRFMALLVDQRNASWMDVINEAQGDLIVVAAGALHLGGEKGILNLLAIQGYALSRQKF